MTNLLTLLPNFDTLPYSHILPSLEKALVSTADLITLDAGNVAKRAQVPSGEVKKLADAVLVALHASLTAQRPSSPEDQKHDLRPSTISTLDDALDVALGGGIATGHLTEIVGESAVGKTQMLLTLLLAVQLNNNGEGRSSKSALYISTEAPLQTVRLTQILNAHPKLVALPVSERPSLSRIHSTQIHDLEAQEHILRYQVPAAIQKHDVGLVVVDSIAANYRAEFDRGRKPGKHTESLAERNRQIMQIGTSLRELARVHNVAIVVANQVADRFLAIEPIFRPYSQSTQGTRLGSSPPSSALNNTSGNRLPDLPAPSSTSSPLSTDDPLALDHQQCFFTGWGDDPSAPSPKTPSLGLAWTNQLACRIALLKEPIYSVQPAGHGEEKDLIGWRRFCRVVFSAWCAESCTDFEIWEGGVRSLPSAALSDIG